MDIPVSGYLYESNDSDPMHSHRLYITYWNGRPVPTHTHGYDGLTSFDDGHTHSYAGTTEPAQSGGPHTHRYSTFTTIDNGHGHQITGITGPAIPVQDGGHYHEFNGFTTTDGLNPHKHSYSGRTKSEGT